jgi:diketogulonate reductase-like aldo/keto reductase
MTAPPASSDPSKIRTIDLGGQQAVPVLGQGTWRMGEDGSLRAQEAAALRAGVELGLTLIDTAEMYGDGATETFLGEALAGLRGQVFLVSKVYPQNAGRGRIEQACEGSLRRLRTDHLDLYLLHWRGSIPLAETIEGMEALLRAGRIKAWGVSNFDTADMAELFAAGGEACATNQVLYNITERGPEFSLLPNLAQRGIPAMAYSPVGQGDIPTSRALSSVAERHGATAYQIALAWVLRHPNVLAIPKAASARHVEENRRAADLVLTPDDLRLLDAEFAPPSRKTPLAML